MQQNLNFRKSDFGSSELSNVLEQAYMIQAKGDRFIQKQSFGPSFLSYNHTTCPKYWYHLFKGVDIEEDVDPLGIAVMASGTAAHDRIQQLFQNLDILVAKEIEITMKSPPIRGYLDMLVRWGDEIVVGEIKTTNQESFMYRQATMKPSVSHLIQLLIYMRATGKQKGFFYYENRNTLQFLIIPVIMNEKNEKILDDVLGWLKETYSAFENDTMPLRPFRKSSKMCKHCPIAAVCWLSENDGEIKINPQVLPEI